MSEEIVKVKLEPIHFDEPVPVRLHSSIHKSLETIADELHRQNKLLQDINYKLSDDY